MQRNYGQPAENSKPDFSSARMYVASRACESAGAPVFDDALKQIAQHDTQ